MPNCAAALAKSAPAFQKSLRAWYRANARALPWRRSPSVYKTVVSEFMLQQTQVKTVLPYFARWMEELPDFAALAAAPESRILKLWEGLGYYSRARHLHRLAKQVAALPALPRTAEGWRELPGVGPYTAAAIASIAFDAPAACVDGNVVRILARLTSDESLHETGVAAAKAFAPLAQRLLPATSPGDHNQAMMELGATVCLRAKPLCLLCPVRPFCAGARRGIAAELPRFRPKATEKQSVIRLWCEKDGALLLHRGSQTARRLAGLHELPTPEHAGMSAAAAKKGRLLARNARSITRFRITEWIHVSAAPRGPLPAGVAWAPIASLETLPLSGPHRRWITAILADRPASPRSAPEFAP